MTRAVQDRAIGIVIFVLAGATILYTARLSFEAGLFPRLVATVMLIAAAGMVVRSFFAGLRERAPDLVINGRLLAITLVASVLYVLAVRSLGYLSSSAIFVPALAYLLGLRSHRAILVGTVLFITLMYLVFVRVFQLPLPREMLLDRLT